MELQAVDLSRDSEMPGGGTCRAASHSAPSGRSKILAMPVKKSLWAIPFPRTAVRLTGGVKCTGSQPIRAADCDTRAANALAINCEPRHTPRIGMPASSARSMIFNSSARPGNGSLADIGPPMTISASVRSGPTTARQIMKKVWNGARSQRLFKSFPDLQRVRGEDNFDIWDEARCEPSGYQPAWKRFAEIWLELPRDCDVQSGGEAART